jgi:putative flippase GtrA
MFQASAKVGLTLGRDASSMTTTTLVPPLTIGPSVEELAPDVEIVVPVYNEQAALAMSVERLHRYLTARFPLTWLITVADNASTDNTWGIACRLAKELDGVQAVHLGKKGRGRALRSTWMQSTASVVAYMDVDLSTDLDALLPLVAPLITGHSDVAIGSRLTDGARVVRGPKRELISRAYNVIVRMALHSSFSDAQCGFKAVRSDIARQLVPLVEDDGWFFDTELLVLAERNGLRVHEVAVDWVDDPDSRVAVLRTATDDLKGVARMMRDIGKGKGAFEPGGATASGRRRPEAGSAGQALHFAGVGLVSTLAFAVLFSLLYGPLGAIGADLVALALCALGNLAANRRFTFASRGRLGRGHYYARGAALALLPMGVTLVALAATMVAGLSSLLVDIPVLAVANLTSTAARYQFLRAAVARPWRPGVAQ